MSKHLLSQPTPPTPANARKVYGLADSDDLARRPNPANDARAAATKRLSAEEVGEIISAYRRHLEEEAESMRAYRKAIVEARKGLMLALARRFRVSPTAIERAVGTR